MSPSTANFATPETRSAIQKLFDDATADSLAPGYQFVVFDRESTILNSVSGYSDIPSPAEGSGSESTPSDGVKMRPDHIHWIMSASKIALSIAALIALEKGLTSNGMTINDLDNHEKLVEILPEFKLGGGSWVTKIIDGWEEGLDEQGRKIPKLRDTKTPVTLRMLFTHSTGLGIIFIPFDGSVALKKLPMMGLIDSITIPAVVEPGTTVRYGYSADWLGQWLVRSTGRNLRDLLSTYVLKPLEIPAGECDSHLREDMLKNMSGVYLRTDDPKERFKRDEYVFCSLSLALFDITLSVNDLTPYISIYYSAPRGYFTCEGAPPPGYTYQGAAPLMASTQAFSILLQAVLKHDTRLLSEKTWIFAEGDALAGTNIKIPIPRVPTAFPTLAAELETFAKPVDPAKAGTMNLLNTELALGPEAMVGPGFKVELANLAKENQHIDQGSSYHNAPSYMLWNLTHSYYMIDPINGFGYMWSSQCGPWASAEVLALRDDLEKLLYRSLAE
ncbi:beta-lactamase/transpeptidase-like protein [Clavulina sp. PMI_390]|nr:beta-lactamase/transpeptidase-like protein [Clavulina sp. PMI_390]